MTTVPASESAGIAGGVPIHSTVLIARLARVVRRRFAQTLAPLSLSERDIVALSYLRGHGPTAQQELAARLCLDPSGTVCLLNELEDAGLLKRRRDRSDRRRALLELTAKGERTLARVDRVLDEAEADMLAVLDPSERAELHRLLLRLEGGGEDIGASDASGL